MPLQNSPNNKAPLLSWDLFGMKYNSLAEDAEKYRQSVAAIRQIARANKWSKEQIQEAIDNLREYVIIITDPLQNISFAGKGFYEMTGYTFDEAKGRNPNFLQGPATNKRNTSLLKEQLVSNAPGEVILENYRRNGDMYLCKILIKPVININQKLVNYIAYEQEVAA